MSCDRRILIAKKVGHIFFSVHRVSYFRITGALGTRFVKNWPTFSHTLCHMTDIILKRWSTFCMSTVQPYARWISSCGYRWSPFVVGRLPCFHQGGWHNTNVSSRSLGSIAELISALKYCIILELTNVLKLHGYYFGFSMLSFIFELKCSWSPVSKLVQKGGEATFNWI